MSQERREGALREVCFYFLRLGCIAFGGPAAHIALMRRELVQQRQWLSDREFVDFLGITNLIPGPNSTEMTMHLGARRAGWWGLWAAGALFILPAVLIVLAIAWAYVRWGDTPAGEALAMGIQPVMLAIIVQAIWGLRTAAFASWRALAAGVLAGALALAGVPEVVLVVGAGLLLLAWSALRPGPVRRLTRPGLLGRLSRFFAFAVIAPPGYSAWQLFWVFLKIGALLYGSGYVLVAFLDDELVGRGWLTPTQLVDAVSVGQFTPGPVFSAATFAGYVVDGWRGAALATLGIFLPSFVFVAATHPLAPRLRNSPRLAPFLDGVNAAAFALMAVVTVRLAREAVDGWFPALLLAAAAVVLLRYRPNSALLVLAGAAAGLAYAAAA